MGFTLLVAPPFVPEESQSMLLGSRRHGSARLSLVDRQGYPGPGHLGV